MLPRQATGWSQCLKSVQVAERDEEGRRGLITTPFPVVTRSRATPYPDLAPAKTDDCPEAVSAAWPPRFLVLPSFVGAMVESGVWMS